ncbi:hypothetical protein Bbelb_190880 [Branchiostoma belcheri]|nr:hypothetical protein Bbelb_190880 [Branchiostoma belcheri]
MSSANEIRAVCIVQVADGGRPRGQCSQQARRLWENQPSERHPWSVGYREEFLRLDAASATAAEKVVISIKKNHRSLVDTSYMTRPPVALYKVARKIKMAEGK